MSRTALSRLRSHLGDGLLSTHSQCGDETAVVERTLIRPLCVWLRDTADLEFNMLTDLTAVDYLDSATKPRFAVVYHLYSIRHKHRLRLKAGVPHEDPTVDTVCDIWRVANWLEREVWDMYGIRFNNHPDMRRILMYEEFVGHPLRKDYPKQNRQPLIRRPKEEIEQAMAGRPGSGKVPGRPRNLLEDFI